MNLRLHHFGVLVRDIPEASDYYLQLGYRPETELIHDPNQTVYAQFFRLPQDRVFLELISPDRPDSKLSNALKKGEGLNHICYSTDNMDRACEWFSSSGSFLIAPPADAVAFPGRRIAWFRGVDRVMMELLEAGPDAQL